MQINTTYFKQIDIKNDRSNSSFHKTNLKPNNINFSGKINKSKKGIWSSIIDFINSSKKEKQELKAKKELELRLKIEAENKARKIEEAKKLEKIKKLSKETLSQWQTRNQNKFQKRIYTDDTGDITMSEDPFKMEQSITSYAAPPKKGEYSLANIGIHGGYASKPLGQTYWMIKSPDETLLTPLTPIYYIGSDNNFAERKWRIVHTYTQSYIDKDYHKCTVLSAGFEDKSAYALSRFPGVNFVIEGHISHKDMSEIKKNIVEKGLWKNYIENQDDEAHLGIYNEIINYLNK